MKKRETCFLISRPIQNPCDALRNCYYSQGCQSPDSVPAISGISRYLSIYSVYNRKSQAFYHFYVYIFFIIFFINCRIFSGIARELCRQNYGLPFQYAHVNTFKTKSIIHVNAYLILMCVMFND